MKAVKVEVGPAQLYVDKVGEVRGSQEVDLRARVSGVLMKQEFVDGSLVQENQRIAIDVLLCVGEIRLRRGELRPRARELRAVFTGVDGEQRSEIVDTNNSRGRDESTCSGLRNRPTGKLCRLNSRLLGRMQKSNKRGSAVGSASSRVIQPESKAD